MVKSVCGFNELWLTFFKGNKVQLLMDLRENFNAKSKQRVEIKFAVASFFSVLEVMDKIKLSQASRSRRCELPLMRSVCDKTGKIT